MNKKDYIFEKICIFFSFCLILYGLYLYMGESNIMDPIDDVNVVLGEDKVIITDKGEENSSTSSDQTVESSDSNSNISGDSSTLPNVSAPSTNESANESTNSSLNTNTTIPNNRPSSDGSGSENNDVITPVTPTVEQANDSMRRNLEQTYGISVKYGREIAGYSVGDMSTIGLNEASDVTYALDALRKNLEKYPSGFFKEFSKAGMSLSVYLIYSYSDDTVTGVTDSTYDSVVISIATKYPFSDSFNHEAYHYVEKFIENKGGTFNSWDLLNPVGFSYGNIDSRLSYDRTLSAQSYFVNNYAQTDDDEDRASTFEYMMADVECKCLGEGLPIWNKAKHMANVIDLFFSTVNSYTVEYWERFI